MVNSTQDLAITTAQCPQHHKSFIAISLSNFANKRLFCQGCIDAKPYLPNIVSLKEVVSGQAILALQEEHLKRAQYIEKTLTSAETNVTDAFDYYIKCFEALRVQMKEQIDLEYQRNNPSQKVSSITEKLRQILERFNSNGSLKDGKELDSYLYNFKRLKNLDVQTQSLVSDIRKRAKEVSEAFEDVFEHHKKSIDKLVETIALLSDRRFNSYCSSGILI